MRKLSLLSLIMVFAWQSVSGWHIVGGELYYECLGNNDYQITLKVYRDCFTQGAQFDDPAYVGVFDDQGNLVTNIAMYNPVISVLNPPINNPCLIPPSNICVEEGVYTTIVNLPPSQGGYQLAYQRCCRNPTILNVINPRTVGSTYNAFIPPSNLANCNSSPRFIDFPPIFICINAPLYFNHSAYDPDGDSLVYELCHPLGGADTLNPQPNPPNPPPFPLIPWRPPYHTNDPLGGVPLKIDSVNGILTGVPNRLGQFVVGVCVKEYRNGVLIGVARRDFQFNVVTCNVPIARIPTSGIDTSTGLGIYQINCNDFAITFENQSYNATNYYWDFGDPNSTNDHSTQYEPTYTYSDTGTYIVTLVASQANGCADTTQAVVKIYPVFQADFTFDNVCQDSAVQFVDLSWTTIGNIDSWKWNFGDGSPVSSQANPVHQYNAPGTYNVRLTTTTNKGCVESIRKVVTVYPVPEVNFTTGSACVNAVTSFNNLTTIASGRIRQWLWDFGDGSTSTLENPGHVYQSTGTYQVRLIAIAPHGCRDTFTAPVTVHPLPVVSTSGDTTVCPGFPVQLNASGGVMYQWKPPSLFTNANAAVTQMSTFRDTVVSVAVTDMNGCVDSAFVQINLLPLPPADASPDTFVCKGGSVHLNATGGAGYSWQPSGSLNNANIPNPIATPPDTTTYIVTVIDTNQCTNTDSVTIYVHNPVINPVVADMREVCRNDSIRIYAAGGTDYTWSPPHGISDVHAQYPFFYPDTTTTYIVQVSNYCFSGMDTVTVLVHPLPGVDAGSDRNLCLGDAVFMTGTGTGTFEWQPHTGLLDPFNPNTLALPDTTTAYILTVTDSNGCRNRDTVVLYVYPPPVPDAGADTMICAGGFVRLNASGGTSYQWAPSTGLSCLQCPDPIASPSDSTAYIVTVSDIPGCARSDTVWVFVQKLVHAPAPLDTSLCFGDSLYLGISASHALYYQWLPDDGIILSDNSGNATISLTSNQTYILAVSNDCFSDTTTVTVDVLPLPAADAGEDQTIYRDETALLNATGGIHYHWRPEENLENPYDAQTLASPFSTTTYTVEVTDANGCRDFDTMVVHVIALDLILVPSAFSPNHDGHNDIFRIIRTLNIEKLITFEVYNRWGEKVFETDDPARGWGGTYREEPQEVGTYVYVIKAINRDNELIEVSGNVTLVR